MTTATQVLFAEEELTVHKKLQDEPAKLENGEDKWLIESKILLPGQYIPVDDIPPYVVKDVKAGKVPGAKIYSETRAKNIAKKADEVRQLVEANRVVLTTAPVQTSSDAIKVVSSETPEEELESTT